MTLTQTVENKNIFTQHTTEDRWLTYFESQEAYAIAFVNKNDSGILLKILVRDDLGRYGNSVFERRFLREVELVPDDGTTELHVFQTTLTPRIVEECFLGSTAYLIPEEKDFYSVLTETSLLPTTRAQIKDILVSSGAQEIARS